MLKQRVHICVYTPHRTGRDPRREPPRTATRRLGTDRVAVGDAESVTLLTWGQLQTIYHTSNSGLTRHSVSRRGIDRVLGCRCEHTVRGRGRWQREKKRRGRRRGVACRRAATSCRQRPASWAPCPGHEHTRGARPPAAGEWQSARVPSAARALDRPSCRGGDNGMRDDAPTPRTRSSDSTANWRCRSRQHHPP